MKRLLLVVTIVAWSFSPNLLARGTVQAQDKKAEQIAEQAIAAYGGLQAVILLRQRGQMRGIIKTYLEDGSSREGDVVVRFLHRIQNPEDLRRVELKFSGTPDLTICYDGTKVWGTENGATVVLRLRTEAAFKAELIHSYEALLRYREFKYELKYVGKEKKSGIDLDVIDLKHTDGSLTRYFISQKSFRILHIEYDVNIPLVQKPVRFRDSFFDFRVVQSTVVPYRVERYEDNRLVQEIRYTEVAYGVQIEEAAFKQQTGQ